jgi:hypothetical protein
MSNWAGIVLLQQRGVETDAQRFRIADSITS